jgi:hypothetical protein
MALKNGFIKVYRSLVDWEWYGDINTTRLFLHLLMTVNYEEGKWQGKEIKRGQRVTSVEKLALETKLSPRKIRTSLSKLKTTGELTIKTTNKYTLITVENYGLYQARDEQSDKQNDKQHGKQMTTKKEEKEIKNIYTAEFDSFYLQYPRSEEKQRTFKNWGAAIKDCTAEELIQAAQNYKEAVKNRDKEYMKASANFLGKDKIYKDYLFKPKDEEKIRW